jgi:hypothetical protein
MRQLCLFLFSVIAFTFCHAPANASSDYSCTPQWTAVQPEFGNCTNSAILGPGNDTRVNLLLLMHDFYPAGAGNKTADDAPLFEWRDLNGNLFSLEYGGRSNNHSRCASNIYGAEALEKAVNAARDMSAEERKDVIAARNLWQPDCNSKMPMRVTLAGIKSTSGREFVEYIGGAMAFYEGDFAAAANTFSGLSKAKNPWVRETASYMLARTALNSAQENAFDEYGYFDPKKTADSVVLGEAGAAFQRYLKNWPTGQYAASAKGLMRRVFWLSNDPAKLAAEYRWQLAQSTNVLNHADFAEEIDLKLLPYSNGGTFGGDPLLVAVMDLMRMRKHGGYENAQITLAEIKGQKPIFAKRPELHEYLIAAHAFYVEKKPAEVLALIPDAARTLKMNYIQFTRQALRGLALEAVKDRNARGFWEQLIPNAPLPYQRPVAELALAMNMERSNALADVFAPKSAVQDTTVRRLLMLNVASPSILRSQAKATTRPESERGIALFTLLYKGLSRGRYAEFVSDLDLTPKDAPKEGYFYDFLTAEEIPTGLFKSGGKKGEYSCPHVRESAAILAKNASDAISKLCVADFLRVNGFDQISLDTQPDANELGGTKSLFPGQPYSRLETYKGLIADPKVAADHKAYALYRAVWCYGPGGNNSCGGKDVALPQRKAWHDQLKRSYPNSPWAKKLQYFW